MEVGVGQYQFFILEVLLCLQKTDEGREGQDQWLGDPYEVVAVIQALIKKCPWEWKLGNI